MDTEDLEREIAAYREQDTVRIKLLNKLAHSCQNINPGKCIEASEQAIELALKLNEQELLAEAYNFKARAHMTKGEYDESYNLEEKSLEIHRSLENETGAAFAIMNMGELHRLKSDFIKAQEKFNESLKMFEALNDRNGISRVLSLQGSVYLGLADYPSAKNCYQEALSMFEESGDTKRIAGTLSNMGGIYYFTGDYPKALEYYQKALTINEQLGNKMWMLSNLGNIGDLYFELSDIPKSLEYLEKALKLSEEINYRYGMQQTLTNIGSIYGTISEYEKSLGYFKKGLILCLESGDKLATGGVYLNLGNSYLMQSNFTEAFENLEKALKTFEDIGSQDNIADSLLGIGSWHFKVSDDISKQLGFNFTKEEKLTTALQYVLRSLKISEEINTVRSLEAGFRELSDIYSAQGDFEKALDAYKKFIEIRDKVLNEESKKQITRKEMQYEFDKKESLAKAEQEKKDALALKELQRQKFIRNTFVGGFTTVLLFAGIFFKQRNKIKKGKELSDKLLLNILPEEVAEELKAKGSAEAKHFDEVTVMFTDFKGFTQISEKLSPAELVTEIDTCFKAFDNIISKYNIEKIKTIGDSYMCAGGLPVINTTNATDVVSAALEIQKYMHEHFQQREKEGKEQFEIRIGIHTGSVVAGIVGVKKFAYDIWGNTVNIASRMESSGEPGKVNISGATYELVKDKFSCTYRGKIEAKNKGMIDMYFVEGEK